MALTKCKECGAEVSKKAKQCPKCGAPAKKKTSFATWLVVALIVAGFVSSMVETGEQAAASKQAANKAAKATEYFKAHTWDVIGDINSKIKEKNYTDALGVIEKYLHTGDKELKALYKTAQAGAIVEELKTVPASDVEKNAKLYAQLVELEPTVKKYKTKLDSYKIKADRLTLIRSQFSAWDGSHNNLEKTIKASMNDPDSYEHDKTTYNDMGGYLLVVTQYRGKNGFGALVRGFVKAKVGLDGAIIKILEQS